MRTWIQVARLSRSLMCAGLGYIIYRLYKRGTLQLNKDLVNGHGSQLITKYKLSTIHSLSNTINYNRFIYIFVNKKGYKIYPT